MKNRLGLLALGAALGFGLVNMNPIEPWVPKPALSLISISQADARPRGHARREVRRVSRRTARRTTRRVVRRTSVAGCPLRTGYYYCGGVYYRPITENGTTVYIVVNP